MEDEGLKEQQLAGSGGGQRKKRKAGEVKGRWCWSVMIVSKDKI